MARLEAMPKALNFHRAASGRRNWFADEGLERSQPCAFALFLFGHFQDNRFVRADGPAILRPDIEPHRLSARPIHQQ